MLATFHKVLHVIVIVAVQLVTVTHNNASLLKNKNYDDSHIDYQIILTGETQIKITFDSVKSITFTLILELYSSMTCFYLTSLQ